jgi:hypothetical protein
MPPAHHAPGGQTTPPHIVMSVPGAQYDPGAAVQGIAPLPPPPQQKPVGHTMHATPRVVEAISTLLLLLLLALGAAPSGQKDPTLQAHTDAGAFHPAHTVPTLQSAPSAQVLPLAHAEPGGATQGPEHISFVAPVPAP